ncbi:hypothetical protein EJP69_21430 [Variovorax gossypii]|uniref:Uncharacterized protein n=1 Tax=Variovorax gossypii TaxID=1679495 RepID=A0A431TII9_9BURK|nr:hypothetical protein EJP69_21430 [Variovorax gossypii]
MAGITRWSHECSSCRLESARRATRRGRPHYAGRFAASLRCSRFAGSRRTRFAQTAASPCPRNAALLGGTEEATAPCHPPGSVVE